MKNEFQFGAVVLSLMLASAGFLLISGCSIEKPKAPSWDTTWQIPLVNKTYTSGELLEKLSSDNIKIDSAGNSFFYIEKELDTLTLEEALSFADMDTSFEKHVGNIKVLTPDQQSVGLAFADYVTIASGEVADTGMWVEKPLSSPSSITAATIASGEQILRVSNNTGFDLDSLVLEIRQLGGAAIVSHVVAGGLAIGQSATD
jgi:hypothetical protein